MIEVGEDINPAVNGFWLRLKSSTKNSFSFISHFFKLKNASDTQ